MELTSKVIGSLYTEAMLLADEARAYFDETGRGARDVLSPMARVTFSCESLKVTTRLMHVVAWLLARRSQMAGQDVQITPLSAAAPTDERSIASLPSGAREIIMASTDLYARVERLDTKLIVGKVPYPAMSPVFDLRERLQRAF